MRSYLLTFFILWPACSLGASKTTGPQRTICTVTINSADEKKVFQKHFGKDFKFIELTKYQDKPDPNDPAANEGIGDSWFENACDAGVQCDVLVISGHFDSNGFFNEKGDLTLTDMALQQRSCEKTCDGILKRPKEVYLLGCNTLSKKEGDSRTPQEYYKVLLQHGVSPTAAARIAAGRYSPIGESNLELMQKAFQGVPKIYGFDTVSYLGATAGPIVDKYLSHIPDYKKRLDELEAGKVVSLIDQANQTLSGAQWNSLRRPHYPTTTCSGSGDNYDLQCSLFSENKSRYEKLLTIEKMLNSDEPMKYMLSIQAFLENSDMTSLNSDEKASWDRIRANRSAQKEYDSVLTQLEKSPALSIPFFVLGRQLGWVNDERIEKSLAANFKTGLTEEDAAAICSAIPVDERINMHLSSISAEALHSVSALTALKCMRPTDPALLIQASRSLGDTDPAISNMSFNLLYTVDSKNPEVVGALTEIAANPNASGKTSATTLLQPPASTKIVVGLLATEKSAEKKSAAVQVLRNLKPNDPEILRMIKAIDPSVVNWN